MSNSNRHRSRERKEVKSTGNDNDDSVNLSDKDEILVDEPLSPMSDLNPPSLTTRLRQRKVERRRASRAASTNSSVIGSDARKTKSEPILITIDSDSEEEVSVADRSTPEVRGELLKHLSRGQVRSCARVASYKDTDSTSSYESVKGKKKKKPKRRTLPVVSTHVKRKKYFVNRLSSKTSIKFKRSSKAVVKMPHVYTPAKKRRRFKMKNLRKHLKRQKREGSIFQSNIVTRRNSQISSSSIKKRETRNSRTVISDEISNASKDSDKNKESEEKEDSSKILKNLKVPKIEPEEIVYERNSKNSGGETITEHSSKTIDVNSDDKVETSKIEDDIKKSHATKTPVPNDKDDSSKSDHENEENKTDASLNETESIEQHVTKEIQKEECNAFTEVSNASIDNMQKNKINGIKKKKVHVSKAKGFLRQKSKPTDGIIRKRGRPRLNDPKRLHEKPVKMLSVFTRKQIPFLQNSFCFDVAPKLPKCRECRIAVNRNNRKMFHSYCRFMEYRKLYYNRAGVVLNAGFSEPSEVTEEHLQQWLPQPNNAPCDLNFETSKALLEHIGDQFCDLIQQEREAMSLHIGQNKIITWKRIVQGVREMCDVCYTTIFNIHWVCPVCGFAVCIDCYKVRKQGIIVEDDEPQPKNRDEYKWLLCTMKQPHEQSRLIMAQIIPGSALWQMQDLLHCARKHWNIPAYCKCNPEAISVPNKKIATGICKQLMCNVTSSFSVDKTVSSCPETVEKIESIYDDLDFEVNGHAIDWLNEVNYHSLDSYSQSGETFHSFEDFASLRNDILPENLEDDSFYSSDHEFTSFSLNEIIECFALQNVNRKVTPEEKKSEVEKITRKHITERYPQANSGRDPLPIRIYTKIESSLLFSAPHSWFCNGRLLFLHEPQNEQNLVLFQEQWKRGQPILVKGVDSKLDMNLWHPDAFCRDFGDVKNDLVDCRTGAIIKNLPMRTFWEGFENFSKRMKDKNGEYMLLKLKDWPPGEDFSEKLPKRFKDLMGALPLPQYTHRDGILNLAGRLPTWFVRPDLGPKMYNAYGSALYPTKGTTNLHLDVSDAVNVMVYVGIPSDGNAEEHVQEALKAIDEGGCDSLMRNRVRNRHVKPGALWHIYNARDADKIRDLLTKVAIERGEKLEPNHDPIHDQSWYVDAELRHRLYRDYGVEGYAIAQCLGDAVFIPAGAPHQVRNLHSCVKVAEDFVSPENIAHCFKLTQEFRHLSDTHTNHEDKLQIKNIIYHVVRDSLSHLLDK